MSIPYKKPTNPFDDINSPLNSIDNNINVNVIYNEPLLSDYTNNSYVNDTQLDTIYSLSPQYLRESYAGITKYILLCCICLFTFGSYFMFDIPGAIETQLRAHFGAWYDTTDTLILYSVYSVPNCVLALFGGHIIDQITGVRVGCILFCSLVVLGNILFALGVTMKQFWLCVIGRVLFALGGESLTVAQNTITVRWFASASLPLIFGIVIAMSRIGSAINFSVTPLLVDHFNVVQAVWIACSTTLISLLACIIASYCDTHMSSAIQLQRNDIVDTLPEYTKKAVLQHDVLTNDESGSNENNISLSDIQYFPITAWMLFLICCLLYIPVLSFNEIASEIIQSNGYDADTASLYVAIPNFVAILAVPSFGKLVGGTGYALYAIAIAATMTLSTQACFLSIHHSYLPVTAVPYIMVQQGLAYSLFASSIWPILSYVVDPKMLGTAYGLQTSVQQIGQVIAPIILSLLPSFEYDMLFFASTSCVTIMVTGILIVLDKRRGSKLNMSGVERTQLQQMMFTDTDVANNSAYLDNQIDDYS